MGRRWRSGVSLYHAKNWKRWLEAYLCARVVDCPVRLPFLEGVLVAELGADTAIAVGEDLDVVEAAWGEAVDVHGGWLLEGVLDCCSGGSACVSRFLAMALIAPSM